MRKIIRIEGKPVQVDAEFVPLLFNRSWFWLPCGYLATLDEDGDISFFHHYVHPSLRRLFVHHIDGDTANNTRQNLTYLKPEEYKLEIPRLNGNTYFGVRSVRDGFEASYRMNGRKFTIGYYLAPESAATSFDLAIRRLFPGLVPSNIKMYHEELTHFARLKEVYYAMGFDTSML